MGFQFNTLLRAILAGGAPPPAPATIYSTYNDQPSALGGFATDAGAGTWRMTAANTLPTGTAGSCFAYRIKGSSASMFASSGDATPFRVVVDSDDFTTATTPTLAAGKIPLFSGLSDTWHTVFIWTDNSATGQGFPTGSANLIEAYGSSAQVLPMGTAYYLGESSFPGVFAGPRIDTTFYPQPKKQVIGIVSQTGWGTAAGSIHMRASYDKLYVFANGEATFVMVSINGALATACSLSAVSGANSAGVWRKVDTPAQSSAVEVVISGGGKDSGVISYGVVMQGVMATGASHSIAAPTATKRHVVMMGASQVEGAVAGAGGCRNDGHLVQNRLNVYLTNNGLSGGTITALNTAIPTVATKYPTKDIAMLSVGINSADDANFQTDYTTLIQSCLTAGWSKVICRGLVTTTAQTSKNAKIAAAVASFSSAAVVYADVASWVATTDGSGGTIAMPDGAHPNAAGFAKMADLWYSDHASLFA